MIRPASAMRLVSSTSSALGSGTPEGWLWLSATAAAATWIAGRKTSRGYVVAALMWPNRRKSLSCNSVGLHKTT